MVTEHSCGFCSRVFRQDEAQPTCANCPLNGGCQRVRCPYCGYENPLPPAWLNRVRAWFGTDGSQRLGGTIEARTDERSSAACR